MYLEVHKTSPPPGPAGVSAAGHTLRFGDCIVQLQRREIVRGGELQPLEPRAFDVLRHLIRHRHRKVSRLELLQECWGSDPPDEGSLTRAIMKIRQALGVGDDRATYIRTLHGEGYQFIAELVEHPGEPGREDKSSEIAARTELGGRVALLPFVNATGDEAFAWIELGLMSVVERALDEQPAIGVVAAHEVLVALRGATTQVSQMHRLALLDAGFGPGRRAWGELRGSAGRLALHFSARTLDGELHHGVVMGVDPAGMARDAAARLRLWMLQEPAGLGDAFLDDTFKRACLRGRVGKLSEAEHLFDVIQDAGCSDARARYEATRTALLLGRAHASEMLEAFDKRAREDGSAAMLAMCEALHGERCDVAGLARKAVEHTWKAFEHARPAGDDELSARLMASCAMRMAMAADDRAVALVSRLVRAAEQLGDSALLCDAYCAAARVAGFRGDWIAAQHHQASAAAIARTLPECARAGAFELMAWVLHAQGELNASVTSAAMAHHCATIRGAQPQQGLAAGQHAVGLLAKGRLLELAGLYETMRSMRVEDASPALRIAEQLHGRVALLRALGDIDGALRVVQELVDAVQEHPWLLAQVHGYRLELLLASHRFDELRAACSAPSDRHSMGDRFLALCEHLQLGDTLSALQRLHGLIDSLPASQEHARASLDTAWLHLECGERVQAARLVAPLRSWMENSPAGLMLSARLRFEAGDAPGAIVVQRRLLAEYAEIRTPTHEELLAIYERTARTGTRSALPVLGVPVSLLWSAADAVQERLARTLAEH